MAVTLNEFFGKLIPKHVKDGLGRPFNANGSANSSYMSDENQSLVDLARKMEDGWISYCTSMTNFDGNSISSGAPTISYEEGSTIFTNIVPYVIDWNNQVTVSGNKAPAYWIIYSEEVNLSPVSPKDIWYDDSGRAYLIEEVNDADNKVLVYAPLGAIVPSSGGNVKGGVQGKISESFHGGCPSGLEQDFDVSGSSGLFLLGETVKNGSNYTGKVVNTDGYTKGYFKSNPIGGDLVVLTDIDFLNVGDLVYVKDYNGQTLATSIIGKEPEYSRVQTLDNISSFSRLTPSWIELRTPSEIATYITIELDNDEEQFSVGEVITGQTSGTTCTLSTDNTDYATSKSNKEMITALFDILKANSPQSIVIIGTSMIPLPLIIT